MEPQKQGKESNKKAFKAKVGLFFGYNGQQFQGMQFQREHGNTIENTLHKVLVDKGFILKSNADQLQKVKWSRAARTDKRVHALCNGISLKLQIYPQYLINQQQRTINYDKIVKDINDQLPIDVRIFCIKKVAKHFDMRHNSFSRIYNYIIPANLFQPYKEFKNNHKITGEELDAVIKQLNQLVKLYLGTHNFHNFTRGYKRSDMRCQRYMMQMSAEKVQDSTVQSYIQKHKEQKFEQQDFIRFTLIGQSFIYNQIRKMIGLLVKIYAQQLEGKETITKALKEPDFENYLAPGQGLYLNKMTFQTYNKKEDIKEKLDFTEAENARVIEYRAYLEQKILDHQLRQKVFTDWLIAKVEKQQELKGQSEQQKSINDQ